MQVTGHGNLAAAVRRIELVDDEPRVSMGRYTYEVYAEATELYAAVLSQTPLAAPASSNAQRALFYSVVDNVLAFQPAQ